MEFARRLNIWTMIMHATGVANVLMTTKFLEETVYSALANGKEWRIVHELLLVYLKAVDDEDDKNVGNIFATGGQDTKMKEAEANAAIHFRLQRGGPAGTGGGPPKPWDCDANPNAKQICISFNLKQDHPATAIDPATGKCKFKHVCDAFVTGEDGKRAQCGAADHCRETCDNPKKIATA